MGASHVLSSIRGQYLAAGYVNVGSSVQNTLQLRGNKKYGLAQAISRPFPVELNLLLHVCMFQKNCL